MLSVQADGKQSHPRVPNREPVMHHVLKHFHQNMKKCFVGGILCPLNHKVLFDHIQQREYNMLPEITLVSHYDAVFTKHLVQLYGMVDVQALLLYFRFIALIRINDHLEVEIGHQIIDHLEFSFQLTPGFPCHLDQLPGQTGRGDALLHAAVCI
ncbi:hypothetical protein ES708_28862 [subsurface metagenome]